MGQASYTVIFDVPEGGSPLLAGHNLSDVENIGEARRCLGVFPSKVSAECAHIAPMLETIRLDGYYVSGDGGEALYRRVETQPSHSGKLQSNDGAWWELAEMFPNNRMFGAKVDGVKRTYKINDSGAWTNISSIGASNASKTDDTFANQALIDFVAAKGGGIARYCAGVSVTKGLIVRSSVLIMGEGKGATVLQLRDGSDQTCISSEDAHALFGTASKQGVFHSGVVGLTLDGNWLNQSTGGCGIEFYGYSNLFRDLSITLCKRHGLRTEWAAGGPILGIENTYDNIYIDTVGMYGIWNRGPNDSKFVNCVVIDAGQMQESTYDAWRFEAFAPSRLSNCHGNNRQYGAIQTYLGINGGFAFRHCVVLNDSCGGLNISTSHFEGGGYCNALFKGADTSVDASCFFYAPWNGLNVIIKAKIVFNGKIGGPITGRPAAIGIKLGDADNGTNNVSCCMISSQISGCTAGALDFTYCGSANYIVVRGFQNGGTGRIGAVPVGNTVDVVVGGATANGSYVM